MSTSDAGEPAAEPVRLALTGIIHSPLVDRAGGRLGRVDDVIARFAEGGYPPVTGLVGRIAGRRLFIPRDRIADMKPGSVQLAGEDLNLSHFERRQGEVLLGDDVLGRRLISVDAGRLVVAHDIELRSQDGKWVVAGVDTRPRGLRGRLLGGRSDNPGFVDWAAVEPFVGHVPSSRLLMPLRRLRRLHPAQIADLVEAASHDEGEEIISAVHGDPELEADVFEELNTEHQVEFLRDKSDAEAAAVLAEMGPDDAADLVTELDQPRRAPILSLLPPTQQAKVRALLSYGQSSAGGLMSPDFVSVTPDATVSDAIAAVCAADVVPQVAADVFLLDDGHLAGSVPLIELLRADGATRIADLVEHSNASVNADDDFPEVARRMADFNLTVVAVLDDDNRVVGVITVDDVLEAMLPNSWRRRAEADGD
ncbi:MAG: CBS domain-containing protein [Candidatus Dormiibacterota bacterium]|jgi:CBS domain-containing protein